MSKDCYVSVELQDAMSRTVKASLVTPLREEIIIENERIIRSEIYSRICDWYKVGLIDQKCFYQLVVDVDKEIKQLFYAEGDSEVA